MDKDTNLLFVYGTLLASDGGRMGRSQRVRLARESRSVGAGWTEGLLYNLGRYPGLVLPTGPGVVVHGEVLELAIAAGTLRWLDVYERIVPGQHPHNDYERVLRTVGLEAGGDVTAWVYVYRGSLAKAHLIEGGRWASAAT